MAAPPTDGAPSRWQEGNRGLGRDLIDVQDLGRCLPGQQLGEGLEARLLELRHHSRWAVSMIVRAGGDVVDHPVAQEAERELADLAPETTHERARGD
jgi:hypothetical protein